MLDLDWVWPVLASIGLIVVLAAFEFLSIVIAANWDSDEISDGLSSRSAQRNHLLRRQHYN